ncbi:MAG: DUF4234 domain-containing protein [Dehalococcoidia bacterium]
MFQATSVGAQEDSITLAPKSGSVGTLVTVSGPKLSKQGKVRIIYFDSVTERTTSFKPLDSASDGSWTVAIEVPESKAGVHKVKAEAILAENTYVVGEASFEVKLIDLQKWLSFTTQVVGSQPFQILVPSVLAVLLGILGGSTVGSAGSIFFWQRERKRLHRRNRATSHAATVIEFLDLSAKAETYIAQSSRLEEAKPKAQLELNSWLDAAADTFMDQDEQEDPQVLRGLNWFGSFLNGMRRPLLLYQPSRATTWGVHFLFYVSILGAIGALWLVFPEFDFEGGFAALGVISLILFVILFSFLPLILFRYWAYLREAGSIYWEPRSTDHIKHRNMVVQIVLYIFTLGVYAIYWYYITLRELHIANGKNESVLRWTVLFLIPFGNFWSWWHYSSEGSTFARNRWLKFVIIVSILPFMFLMLAAVFDILNEWVEYGFFDSFYLAFIFIMSYGMVVFHPVAWFLTQKELNSGTSETMEWNLKEILSLVTLSIITLSLGLFLLMINRDGYADDLDLISFLVMEVIIQTPIIIRLAFVWRGPRKMTPDSSSPTFP